MQHERGRKVRLLVAPDAVAGAEQLGVVFPKGSAPQSAGAAVSAPIEIIDEGGLVPLHHLGWGNGSRIEERSQFTTMRDWEIANGKHLWCAKTHW